ncbi:hypothetical protein G6L37_00485 [Agrobacterium rubi]|nr:hypothetical protein [Agrobacterium rubi]NTF23866.1 hypothetical protein [Agrobacterium rubi]
MNRTFNWTDRLTIPQQDLKIITRQTETGEIELDVQSITLSPSKSQQNDTWPSARVILLARDKVADADFEVDLGSVSDISSAIGSILTTTLPGFRNMKSVKFTLLVLGSDKRYLARIDDFPASQDSLADRDELFPTRHDDLDEKTWDYQIDPAEGPILILDTEYARDNLRAEETVAIILPMLLKVGLMSAVRQAAEHSEEDWVIRWIRFGEIKMGTRPDCSQDDQDDVIEAWVNGVVNRFTKEVKAKSTLLNSQSARR